MLYVHRILERDLEMWVAVGWVEAIRDRVPSISEDVVLIEWRGKGKPPMPSDTI